MLILLVKLDVLWFGLLLFMMVCLRLFVVYMVCLAVYFELWAL